MVNGILEGVDIPHDDYPLGDARDGLRTIVGSGSHVYTDLPTGADCRVSEVEAGFPLPPEQVTIDQPAAVPDADTSDALVGNDYHTSTLQIVKDLRGEGVPAWATADFSFDFSCRLTDTGGVAHVVFSRSGIVLNAADLESEIFTGIPVGADCTVTETASGGADVPSAPVQVRIVDSELTRATLTNEFNLGSLRVTLGMTLDGVETTAAPFVNGRYEVEVTCTRIVNGEREAVDVPGGAVWTFVGPGEHVFTGLPVGAKCAVHQNSASLTPQDVTFTPANSEPSGVGSNPVVVTAAQEPASLGVVDHFLTGTLVVTKALSGTGASDHAVYPFEFSVICTLAEAGLDEPHVVLNTTFSLSVASGMTKELDAIPVGSECTVKETGSGGATIPAEPATVTITEAGVNPVTLTNAFGTGSVVVTKAITVDGKPSTAEPYASGRYIVALTCTQLVDNVVTPVVVPGGATRTITGSGKAEFVGLPLGAECQVSETGSSLAIPSDQVTISEPKVTVGGEPVETVVTNDFRTTSLLLEWHQTGVGTGFAGPATFTVDCTLDGASGSVFRQEVTLSPAASNQTLARLAVGPVLSPTFAPIPVGAKCTVTQSSAAGADSLSAPVMATGTTSLLAVVANEYSAGTLTITKKLTGAGAKAKTDTTFGFAVTCQRADRSALYIGEAQVVGAGSVTVNDAAGQPMLFPAGAHCWAAETATGGADDHQLDHADYETAATVIAGSPQFLQLMVINATNDFRKSDAVDDSDDSDGSLAFTGFGGIGVAGFGALFLLAGVWLVRRRQA